MNKWPILIIPIILLFSGCTELIPSTVGESPTSFSIEPTAIISSSYNPGTIFSTNNFTIPVVSCSVSRTIRNYDNTTWRNPRLSFLITPIPNIGQTQNDYSAIYFRTKGHDQKIASHYLIEFSSNEFQVVFRDEPYSWLLDGYQRIRIGDSEDITLDLFVNQASLSYLLPGETRDLKIVFTNSDSTWSSTYNVRFVVIRTETI